MKKTALSKLALMMISSFPLISYTSSQVCAASLPSSTELLVGAAVKDITPTKNMFPLHRMPNVTLAGTLDPIHVRVIALSSGGNTSLMICSETGRSLGPQIAAAVSQHTGIPLEAIINTSTHSHAAPEIDGELNLNPDHLDNAPNQEKWAHYALTQTLAAADVALKSMQPATVGIGYSKSYINVNRGAEYNKTDKNGNASQWHFLGYNPEGPSDKTLVTLRFNSMQGKPIAYIVNYSVHGTVMHANTAINGQTGISSDIPGLASHYLEENHKGAVAMWLSGAAADQNPIIQNEMYTRNPKTGEFESVDGADYHMLEYLSKIHYYDIQRAIDSIHYQQKDAKINFAYRVDTIPQTDGKPYHVTLQMLRIGDIAFAAFPGELFTSTGMDIKRNSLLKNTIVVNHAWQRKEQSSNYWADDYTISVDGFGANRHSYKPGYLTPTLVKMNNALIDETNQWTFHDDGTATNDKTGQIDIIGSDDIAGTQDDNKVVSASGRVLLTDVHVSYDPHHHVYVDLGNGFKLYPGSDNKIGTQDDVVAGFGHYPQSADGKTAPINWRLLDIKNGQALLASQYILDSVPFNLKASQGNEWATSNLRSWLNSRGGKNSEGHAQGFLATAFTKTERKKLALTPVSMQSQNQFIAYDRLLKKNWWHHLHTSGQDTEDYVWTLSGEEFFRYFGLSQLATKQELGHDPHNYTNAYFQPTPYAVEQGSHVNTGGNGPSFIGYADIWTRSKGEPKINNTYYGVFLGSTGSLNSGRPVTRKYGALPIIDVKLKN